MKIRILLTAIASTLISSAALHAQSDFWTNNTNNGQWDYTSTNWYTDSPPTSGVTYTSGYGTWFNNSATPGTVTIASGGVTSGFIAFQADGYNITGGILSLAGNGGNVNIDVSTGVTATISSYIDSTGVTNGWMTTTNHGTLNLAGGGDISKLYVDVNGSILDLQAGTFNFNLLNLVNGGSSTTGCDFKFTLGTTINVASTMTLLGTSLDLVGFTGATASSYVIATYGSLNGTFDSVLNTPDGYTLNYAYNGNEIALVQTVPEPSTWAMLLGGLGMLTMFRRRRA